jgi:hypothetical protein
MTYTKFYPLAWNSEPHDNDSHSFGIDNSLHRCFEATTGLPPLVDYTRSHESMSAHFYLPHSFSHVANHPVGPDRHPTPLVPRTTPRRHTFCGVLQPFGG